MAQDEKKRPDDIKETGNDAPVLRGKGEDTAQESTEGALRGDAGTVPLAQKGRAPKNEKKASDEGSVGQGDVDLASLDAFGVDTAGEFVRDGGNNTSGKKGAEKKVSNKKSSAKKTSAETAPNKEKKGKYIIPVLRTYHHDTKQIAQTKGGAELRTILAKETEEKRMAQEEYRQNAKDIMKESAVLRDKYKNFTQKKQKQQQSDAAEANSNSTTDEQSVKLDNNITTSDNDITTDEQSVDQKNITRTLSGAAAYMQSVHDQAAKKEVPQEQSSKQSELNKKIEQPAQEPEEQKKEKGGIFARLRGKNLPENVFTQKEREVMQQKQQESVEKETIKDAWKNFKRKKEKLQEMGLRARDVRSYAVTPDGQISNKPLQRQNILLFAIIFFLLAGLIFFILFLALTPAEESATDNTITDVLPVPDILSSEKQVFVNTAEAIIPSDTWQSIIEQDGEQDAVTKYVPYEVINEKESQISFRDFSRSFRLSFPSGLQNAFDSYYFVGKYETQSNASGILIASVRRYGDAFVWMRNWEKNAINAFSTVFPGVFSQVNVNNVTTESRVIDNQDVRVVRHPSSQKEILYYFFGRSILVFVVGDASAIPSINARIRAANTL